MKGFLWLYFDEVHVIAFGGNETNHTFIAYGYIRESRVIVAQFLIIYKKFVRLYIFIPVMLVPGRKAYLIIDYPQVGNIIELIGFPPV